MEVNFVKNEEKILKFWKKNKIFEKSVKQRPKTQGFVFYEGPPTANGRPGIHHVLARCFKDIICRYKTMQGFRVERKAGWDTQGLPVEIEVEKKLGFKSKQDIEKYGIAKFNKECKASVWEYKKEWEKLTERMGFWVDLKNPYITYENDYIESVWWIIKQVWDKGLIYEGHKVVPYCVRCETNLSSHEVAQGYKNIEESSIYVKFPVKGRPNTYFLIWTTTPWTLPANVAVAVNTDIEYVLAQKENEKYILAKDLAENIFKDQTPLKVFSGKDLLGWEYEPVFNFIKPDKKAYFAIAADFVSTKEGTGLVHIAPAFGIDDMDAGKKNNLPILMTVDLQGKFKPEIKPWYGMFVKDADRMIIDDLKSRNLIFKEEPHKHDYPFCWRCKMPLLYYAKDGWFIDMQKTRAAMVESNRKINWVPNHLQEGRFGEWLREVKDWAMSRERYWGTPLPIWQCEKCGDKECVGSVKELNSKSIKKAKLKDLHRPYIDSVILKCAKCGGKMRRVQEILDVWFDSGSMPFSQYHYPFENKNLIDKKMQFPADYICEAIDQTRGWFYTLLAISTLLGFESPYKNVISLGHVLDEKGEKMSKSKGNIVSPWDMMDQYGTDSVRWYFYTVNQPGEPKLFSKKDVDGALKRFIMIFWNCFVFWETYSAKISNSNPSIDGLISKSKNVLDQWIISKLNSLILEVTKYLDEYDVMGAARTIEKFVIEDLSQWHIRRSRPRFQKPETKEELKEASQLLGFVLSTLSRLTAPFTPFISEEIYQRILTFKFKALNFDSVHLADWPKADEKLIDQALEEEMHKARELVALALAQRAKAGIKVRQPLQKLQIKNEKLKINDELLDLIKEEVNVKEIVFSANMDKEAELDIKITPELKREGENRELLRNYMDLRKAGGFSAKDAVRFSSTASDISSRLAEEEIRPAGIVDFSIKSSEEMSAEKFVAKEIIFDGRKELIGIKKSRIKK